MHVWISDKEDGEADVKQGRKVAPEVSVALSPQHESEELAHGYEKEVR